MAETVLICVRASDSPVTVRGSSLDRSCALCGARLLISPEGQRELQAHPATRAWCEPCFAARGVRAGDTTENVGQPLAEKELVPNLWNLRN